ncbi:MAG TPA: ABC transporter substrate-binding protein [Ktedonobacteraceae bacterium]|nr:ABC transporter substrate-binding protein [Ktedonobacteraceae bacterium]
MLSSLLVVFTMLLAACGGGSTTTTTQKHQVLHIGGFVGDAFTKTTSPYNGNANPGTLGMVYEPLFFNNLSDGKYTSLLGQSYAWNSDNTVLTVNLRQNVKWNDGQPFSSADVAFTFNTVLTEAKGIADTNGLWTYLKSVTAPDANSVAFTFKKAYTPEAYYILSQTYIVPQHVWSSVTAPTTANPDLVGTGPFKMKKFSPSLLVYERNTFYWNNAANKIDELDYPAIKDNTTLEEEQIAGQLDWSSFGADSSLKTAYADKDPHNKYWFSSTAIVGLYLNDSKAPFNDPNVRLAISAALDRQAMSTQAENGFETPANTAGVATNNATFLQSTYSNIVTSPDANKVAQYLQASGYTKTGSFYTKNGQKIVVKYNVPNDFSDWVAIANIMKQNLQAVGIDGEVNAISDDNYFSARSTGSFDAMIGGLFAGPTPYYLYNTHLNSINDASRGGFNWGHYHSAAMDALLQQYASTSDTTQQTTLVNQMQDLFAKEMPIIPLLNAANWYEYSTRHFTGWPSQENPYALGPDYDAPGNEIIVTHLQPV